MKVKLGCDGCIRRKTMFCPPSIECMALDNLPYYLDKTSALEEIERLNNIINELEKWLEEQHQFIIEIPAYTKEISIEHKTMEICYENLLDKLQELKGDDKE